MSSDRITLKGNLCVDKGVYVVRARVPDRKTGKRKQLSKSTGYKVKDNTKRKAEQKMCEILKEWERDINLNYFERDETFSEYVNKFLERKSKEVQKNTIHTYIQYAEKHILPYFENIPIHELKRRDIQRYSDYLIDEGLSPNSVRKILVVAKGAFHLAILDEVIQFNYVDDVELPKSKKFHKKVLTEEEAATLINIAKNEGTPIYCAVILALCYGLRRSEICGLHWDDIDFNKNEMYIRNSVTQNGSNIFETDNTKTESSYRTLSLVGFTIPILRQFMDIQLSYGLELNKVCRHNNGKDVQPNYITQKFNRMQKKHNLEHIRFHDLRGTAASLMARCSTPKQLQEFLGHNRVSTTMEIYVQAYSDDRKAVAGNMDALLSNRVFCSEKCSD